MDPHKNEDHNFQDDFQQYVSLIKFPSDNTTRIKFIACGGEHLFAISRINEVFGWGRNNEG